MAEKISQKVYGALCLPFEAAGAVASKSDGLEKVSKLVITIIDGLQNIFARYGNVAILASTVVLKGKLKIVADVISGLNLINRLFEWVCPESGKDVPFWLAKTHTTKEQFILNAKIVSRVFLTAAHVIDFAKLMDAFGLISLGRFASQTVGRIPMINLAKDTLIVVSSLFSMAGGIATLTDVGPKWRRASRRCQLYKEVGDAVNNRNTSSGRVELNENVAARDNLQIRLSGRCKDKATVHAVEHAKLVEKLVANGVDRALIRSLDDAQRAYSEALINQDDDVERQALFNARRRAAQAVVNAIPPATPRNRLLAGLSSRVNKMLKKDDQRTALQKMVKECQQQLDKEIKWNRYLPQGATGGAELDGGLEGYTDLKLDRAIHRKQHEIDAKRADVLRVRRSLHSEGKVGEVDQNQDVRLSGLVSQLSALEENLYVLQQLKNSGRAGVYANHRYEVLKADESNACRKVTKSVIAVAYDVAKIGIITVALTGLALGLATFGWTMAVFALALSVNGLGVFKFFYDELIAKKVDKAPKLTAAPAA